MNLELVAGFEEVDIPEWLLVEVLIRLPVKLVFRLKLVSKRWLSIISHPSFSYAYVYRAASSPHMQRWTFITRNMHIDGSNISNEPLVDMLSCNLTSPGLYALPFPYTQKPQETKYKIFGVSNGLVLYGPMSLLFKAGNHLANYSICNPATGHWIALPPQSSHSGVLTEQIMGFVTRVESNTLMSYRVVCLHLTEGTRVVDLDVFVSESGMWMEYNVRIDNVIQIESYIRPPAVLNGVMHWMTRDNGLLAYDPYNNPECLRFIPLPKDRNPRFEDGRSVPSLCDVNEGRLRYFEAFFKNTPSLGFVGFRVWTLNNYKFGDWILLHRVSFTDILCDGMFSGQDLEPTLLSFHPFDGNTVYFGYRSSILSFNFKNRKLESHGDQASEAGLLKRMLKGWNRTVWWWTLLFVIPPWPISITRPGSLQPLIQSDF